MKWPQRKKHCRRQFTFSTHVLSFVFVTSRFVLSFTSNVQDSHSKLDRGCAAGRQKAPIDDFHTYHCSLLHHICLPQTFLHCSEPWQRRKAVEIDAYCTADFFGVGTRDAITLTWVTLMPASLKTDLIKLGPRAEITSNGKVKATWFLEKSYTWKCTLWSFQIRFLDLMTTPNVQLPHQTSCFHTQSPHPLPSFQAHILLHFCSLP